MIYSVLQYDVQCAGMSMYTTESGEMFAYAVITRTAYVKLVKVKPFSLIISTFQILIRIISITKKIKIQLQFSCEIYEDVRFLYPILKQQKSYPNSSIFYRL